MNPEEVSVKRTLYLVLSRIQACYHADAFRFKWVNAGLCWVVRDELLQSGEYDKHIAVLASLSKMWKRWPMYSGHYDYPVPAFNERTGYRYKSTKRAAAAFYIGNKWDATTHYGAARVALLDWSVKELEQEIHP